MPSADLMVAFFAATLVFAFMPGPAILYTVAQTIARGRRAGALAVLGIHVGGYVHVGAAALGLAVLFAAVPLLYAALKLAGAAYLIWLGIGLLRGDSGSDGGSDGGSNGNGAATAAVAGGPAGPRRAFWQSALVEVLNPKTALFYVAFLPQFVDPAASFPVWLQLVFLGTIVNAVFSAGDLVCVFLADRVTTALRNSRAATRLTRRIGGTILVGLGLNLALARQ